MLNGCTYLARGRHTSKFLLKFSFLVKCACHAMAKHLLSVPAMQWQNTSWNPPYLIITNVVLANFGTQKLPHGLHDPRNVYIKTSGSAGIGVLLLFLPIRVTMATWFAKNDVLKPHWLSMGENRKKPKLCRHIPRAYFCRGTSMKLQSGKETVDVCLVQTVFDFVLRFCHSRHRKTRWYEVFWAGNPLLEWELEWERNFW